MSTEKKVKKKNGTVPSAEASTQKKEKPDPLAKPISIPKKVLDMAKGVGIDLGGFVQTADLMRQRIIGIENAIMYIGKGLDERDKKLAPLVNLAKRLEEQRNVAPQAAGAGGGGSRNDAVGLAIINALAGSGGGSNPMADKFMAMVFQAGLETMFVGQAFVKSMLLRSGPELLAEAMSKAKEAGKALQE